MTEPTASEAATEAATTEPSLQFVAVPTGRRVAYWQWGEPLAAHVVLCVHGLTRQGRDFDALARALLAQAQKPIRIICVDVAGRGRSDWLPEPALYQVPTYAGDMLVLLAHLQQQAPMQTLDWVGTSMGGLIGIAICGQPELPLPLAVRRLVLNDVGPRLEWASIQRIGNYVGQSGVFADLQAAADAMRLISTGFGPHTPAQWLELSRHMVKHLPAPQQGVTLHYDPAIGLPFRSMTPESTAAGDTALWALYDQMTAQTLLLRGEQSDLLTAATAQEMAQRGPRAKLVTFAGVGHAPTLVARGQSQVVADFLLGA